MPRQFEYIISLFWVIILLQSSTVGLDMWLLQLLMSNDCHAVFIIKVIATPVEYIISLFWVFILLQSLTVGVDIWQLQLHITNDSHLIFLIVIASPIEYNTSLYWVFILLQSSTVGLDKWLLHLLMTIDCLASFIQDDSMSLYLTLTNVILDKELQVYCSYSLTY